MQTNGVLDLVSKAGGTENAFLLNAGCYSAASGLCAYASLSCSAGTAATASSAAAAAAASADYFSLYRLATAGKCYCTAISCYFQLFLGISSYFMVFPAISCYQLFPAISWYFH